MIKEKIIAKIQNYFNLAIGSASAHPDLLEKIIAIDITDINLCIYAQINSQGIKFISEPIAVDVKIKGESLALLAYAMKKPKVEYKLNIEGDIVVAEMLSNWLTSIKIDWEAMLSEVVGDSAAHQIMQLLAQGYQSYITYNQQILETVNVYLQEETNFFPSNIEVEEFFAQIGVIRADVDRLAAKIHLLKVSYNHDYNS